MDLSLNNRRAAVAGSTQGIGKAIAIELANLGANITLIARNETELAKVCKNLPNSGNQKHNFIVADFTETNLLKQKIEKYVEDNTINILINNTGGPPPGQAIAAETSNFEKAFSQHLVCNQILAQSVIEGMKSSAYGRIINIISISVKQPIPNLGVSNTIRGAVASWAKTLANELGEFGITVNNILPGYTNTARLQSLLKNTASRLNKTIDETKKSIYQTIPLERFATAEEIAFATAFLASPSAAYINGINLPVDGGRIACL